MSMQFHVTYDLSFDTQNGQDLQNRLEVDRLSP